MMDDNQLIKECRSGNGEVFGEIYDRYSKKIYKFVYYKVFNKESTEDIVGDVFYKALNRLETFDPNKALFSTWLYSIARNAVINYYRSRKENADIDDYFDLGEDQRIEEGIDAGLKLERVEAFLKTLSSKQREIVILRVWQELSYKEIADIVGVSEDGAKMSFSRAVKIIREKFGPLAMLIIVLFRP